MAKKKLGLGTLLALGVGGLLIYKKFIAKKPVEEKKSYDEKALIAEQKKTGKTMAQILWDQKVQAAKGKK